MKRRDLVAPAAVLFTTMTAHGVLETARDALFLTRLGPARLAWAYLAIAGVALLAVTAVRRLLGLRDPRRVLVAFLVAATGGTAVLASVIAFAESAVFALYVWTGLIATLVVPCFWTVIDRSANVGGAKRLFSWIAAAGVLGALAGSVIAALLGRIVDPRYLVSVSAAVFGLATLAAIAFSPRPVAEIETRASREPEPARSRRYLALLIIVGVAATITLTIGNITFKTVVSERLPARELATVFGAIYSGLNVVALAIQLLVTPRVLSRFGVGGALLVLPVIIVVTSSGFVLTGALVATAVLAISDGGLRHSLHRVASEILFLAIPSETRDGAKPAIDAITQRGGQAAAAVLVFAGAALGAGTRGLAAMTALAGLVWLVSVLVIRGAYVTQLRDMLRAGEIQRSGRMPELDGRSLRLLVAALASANEVEALAALELLVRGGGRVPSFVLDHPSDAVVLRGLELLGDERPRALRRLASRSNPQIRAAALALGRNRERLARSLGDREPAIRAVAAVVLGRSDVIAEVVTGSTAERVALARAIYHAPHERHRPTLTELLAADEPEVTRIVLDVFARAPELADCACLLPLLADPATRGNARRVFVAAGARGRDCLIHALEDPRLDVRRHVPRTLGRFADAETAAALVARLVTEPDRITERKILRALGHMRARDPRLPVDKDAIHDYMRRAVGDAVRYAILRDDIAGAASADVQLMVDLLAERMWWSIEHVFRALGILDPDAGLRTVYGAIASNDEARRSAAREIFEHLAPVDLRDPLLAIIDETEPAQRRARCGDFAPPVSETYDDVVGELGADRSMSLRAIARFHG